MDLIEFNLKGNFGLYIFTTGTIQNAPEIKPRLESIFNRIFSSIELGMLKDNPQAYDWVVRQINVTYPEALFIDDGDVNLNAARAAGLTTLKYRDNATLINQLKGLAL